MGGGATMRSVAAKVAGITIANTGLRNIPSEHHPISAAARKAVTTTTRPVSAILSSSSDYANSTVVAVGLTSDKIDDSVQRPCWELDDWEFAGGVEDEAIVKDTELFPRVVFGGVPSLMEAKEATDELKDALDKVYLSTPHTIGSEGSYVAGQDSFLSLSPNSGVLETKVCATRETPSVPKDAIRAFRFLNESPAAQTVVASIASDAKVWDAVLKNEALVDFLQTQKTYIDRSVKVNVDQNVKESVADADFLNQSSPKSSDESSDFKESGSGSVFIDILQSIRNVVDIMISNLYGYFQNFFGGSVEEKTSTKADGSSSSASVDTALGASFLGLAVMVIIVVVLKRG